MNKQKGVSTTLGILLISFLIIVGIGFICRYYMTSGEQPCDQVSGESQNQITDWQTYKNKEQGFEIKYPNDWYTVNYHKENIIEFQNVEDKLYISTGGPCADCTKEQGANISIRIWDNKGPKLNLDDVINGPVYGDRNIFSYKKIKINELDAVKFVRLMDFGSGWPQVIISSDNEYGDQFFIISYSETANSEDLLPIFDQIVSTFKCYIRIGKFEINYDEIAELQKSVDNGHQPWRLDSEMVLRSESLKYGFTNEDLKTIKLISSSNSLGVYKYEIINKSEAYIVTVIQPIPGEFQIWTIQEIELKK